MRHLPAHFNVWVTRHSCKCERVSKSQGRRVNEAAWVCCDDKSAFQRTQREGSMGRAGAPHLRFLHTTEPVSMM